MARGLLRKIHNLLLKKKKNIAVAESCTGGMLSSSLTSLPGSSAYFILGVAAYSNKAKSKLLKVPPKLISSKGAVSKEVAVRMAQNLRRLSRVDLAVAITGIAGPSGGSIKKPVGTVYIAAAKRNRIICKKYLFRGNRTAIRQKASLKALQVLKLLVTSY